LDYFLSHEIIFPSSQGHHFFKTPNFPSEPIEIGKFDLTGSGPFCRLHFHFISDLEAILILDRCDFIEEHPAGYFTLHSVVYRLFLGNQKEVRDFVYLICKYFVCLN
jgi:hypothetical protein